MWCQPSSWPRPTAKHLFIAFLVTCCFIRSVVCTPYDYGFDVDAHLSRRSMRHRGRDAPIVVGGLGGTLNGTMPARKEIRRLEQNTDLWTLYILGLSLMQYTDQSQLLSYYQIAGIHGVPWISWNGVEPTPGNQDTGYCTHVSELFLTWHRPYLALYEQVLFSLIEYIASLYPEDATRARYQTAAESFRIPYMDWAAQPPAGESVLPDSVGGSPFINVSGPNGVQRITNPLYTYLFKPLNSTIFIEAPYDLWLTTVRAPTTQDSSATSNNTAVSLALDQNFPSIQQRLYNLFSNYQNFSTFSNEAWMQGASSDTYDSLESLHDTIHTLSGLQGHMAWIPFSAFDPIFFLHHCMVDRVFALWQILNPESWVLPTAAVLPSYTTSVGETQDSQTPLTPFFKEHDGEYATFWTSDDVRDMGVLGYTYDDMIEFPRSSLLKANAYAQAEARKLINRLYGASSPGTLGIVDQGPNSTEKRSHGIQSLHQRWRGSAASERQAPAARDVKSGPSGLEKPKPVPPSVVVNNEYREWIANIHTEKQALNGTFFIDLFFGDLPDDTTTWAYATDLVGTMSVFAAPGSAMAGMDMTGKHTSGTVPLTSALAQKVGSGELASLEPSEVKPYLLAHLHCGIVMTNGTTVLPQAVSGLGITIVSSRVEAPSSADELPRWGAVEDHFDLI